MFWPREEYSSHRLHAAVDKFACRKEEDSLPLLKAPAKKPKTASLQIRIEEEVRQKLYHYAEFIDAAPLYVVTEALRLLFKRDEEFKHWSAQHVNHNNDHKPKGGRSLFETVKLA
jgi:hypothetical protein